MSRCLYCHQEIDTTANPDCHDKCIRAFYGTSLAPILPYLLDEMEQLVKDEVELSVSVPGVQPKLSLGWIKLALENGHEGRLTIMDALDGNYLWSHSFSNNENFSKMLMELISCIFL